MNILNGPNGGIIIVGGLAVLAATVVLFNSRRIIEGVGAGVGSGINAGFRNAVDGVVPSVTLPSVDIGAEPGRPWWSVFTPSRPSIPEWRDFLPHNPFD